MNGPRCVIARPRGFTLIEVVAALVIFSVGVLMVMQVSAALGTQMRYAGIRSELAALTNERLDSLIQASLPSFVMGQTADTVTVQNVAYGWVTTLTSVTPLLARVDMSLAPLDETGPSHAVTTYISFPWR